MILGIDKRADLRQLVKIIGDDRFSFGSAERLMQTMGLTPGSVSPFGLIHACEPECARDHRRGPAKRRAADLPSEHQYRERDDLVCRSREVPGFARQCRSLHSRVGPTYPRSLWPHVGAQDALPKPDAVRRHFDELVVVDPLDGLLEPELGAAESGARLRRRSRRACSSASFPS